MFQSLFLFAQSVSTSPYSVYGLGSLYESDFGSVGARGSAAIALPSSAFINNKNPASLAFIGTNSFFFDLGTKAIWSTYEDASKKEKKNNLQFSHIAIAFPVNSKSGVSIALKPYSSASYKISDYKLKIGNSNEDYNLDADSKGGLNNFDMAYGYKISNKMTLGATASFYFGNIEDNRSLTVANTVTAIKKDSHYKGMRFTVGNQYQLDSTLVLGMTVKTPSKINADKTQTITSTNGATSSLSVNDMASDDVDYYLPFEIGIGFSKLFKNNINVSLDYERSFWNETNQSNAYGSFSNQDKLSLGLSYFNKERNRHFLDKLHYYSGFSYDSGFLLINDQRVNNVAFSVGLGIPLEHTQSLLNVSYSYGIKGRVSNDLTKENYHKLTLNLSFEAIWFLKMKYN